MIICYEDLGFAFYPMAKVANTSILMALARSTGRPSLAGLGNDTLVKLDWPTISPDELSSSNLFRFTFVRNPWERLVSCYNDKVRRWRSSRADSPYFGVSTDWEFPQFVKWVVGLEEGQKFFKDTHFIPQSWLLFWDSTFVVDFVGRFERLQDDWAMVSARFNLEPLRHLNAREHPHYSSYYTRETRSLVDRYYKMDIEFFGYCFEEQ